MSYLNCLFFAFFLFVISFVNVFFDYEYVDCLLFYSILLHFILMYFARNNQAFLIFTLFSFTYPVFISVSYFLHVPYHLYQEYQNDRLTSFVFVLQSLFLLFMFLRLNGRQFCKWKWNELIIVKHNNFIFYFSFFILLLMVPVSLVGNEAVLSSGTYSGESGSSILFEYCLIFILVCWLFSGLKKNKLTLLFFVCAVYLVLPLLFGKRLPFLMVSLLIFNLFFLNKFKNRYVFVCVSLMLLFLSVLALLRTGAESNVGLINLLFNVNDKDVMSNNQGGVVVSAASYLGLIEDGRFDWYFRLLSLFGTILSPFTVGSFSFPEAYINTSALKYTPIPGNGGLPGVYFYIWGSWFGLVLFSLFFGFIFSRIGINRYLTLYALFLLITFPRWYAYNMIIVVKMGFWFLFIVVFFDYIYKLMGRKCS